MRGQGGQAAAVLLVGALILTGCASASAPPIGAGFVGIGATDSSWEHAYKAAPPSACGGMTDECFGPIVGRHNGRPIYRFSNLLWTPPYVWSFNIDFPRLVIQREALAQAMSMMPKGSNVRRVVVVRPKAGSCALFVVRSSQLAAATGPLMLSELEVALFTPGNLNTGTYDSRKVATLVVQALWGQPYRTCVAAALGGVTSGPGWHA